MVTAREYASPRPRRGRGRGAVLVSLSTLLAISSCSPPVDAQGVVESEEHRFRVVTVVDGLEHPWGIAFLPGGDALVTERPGRVRLIRDGQLQADPVPGGPTVVAEGQGGLLDIELHPRFSENQLVYMTYSKPGERGATTAIARARFDGTRLVDLEDILVTEKWGTGHLHFGSRIVFARDGMLYVGLGERNQRDRAQSLEDHKGTVVRLHDDGRAPEDNPFVGREGARPEIFTYGHRNIQGMALHPETGELWASEHGPRGGDEINVIRAGRNYGWPRITYGLEYRGGRVSPDTALPGLEQPLLHWTPSIAPSGMIIYTGDRFPRWRGHQFHGALAGQQLRRVVFEGVRPVHQETMLRGRSRIRHVKQGPDGYIYLLTDARDGAVLRLEPE